MMLSGNRNGATSALYWTARRRMSERTLAGVIFFLKGHNRLRLALGGVVHKSIRRNKPAFPQLFEMSLPAEKYGTYYEHRAGRYAADFWINRRKCTSSKKIVSRKVPTERCTGPQDVYYNLHHNLCKYGSLRGTRHSGT
ncbi:gonadotropin-releasing hormone receptor [Trichonephila clavipes]|nr:gonadotropin-releasing hormone receptor [Trichonephila clavipes]